MAFNKAKALQEAQKYVTQGKTAQAIKLYQQIVERDPSDLILLNTIGDLYIRERRLGDALKQFYSLAQAYVNEGYTVRAIAIYKKISKLDQSSIDPVLKLGELYLTQGLNREAREQFTAALQFYKRTSQQDKALDVVRKMAQLDPQNPKARLQLAEFAQGVGEAEEAAEAYHEAATLLQREGDAGAAGAALKKAAQLSPNNPRIRLSLAHQAYREQNLAEVEGIISSAPGLDEDPAARRLLLECYLAAHKLDEAEKILLAVFHNNPADFSPIANFAALCIAKKDYEAAFNAVKPVAQELIERKETEALMQTLRKIWDESPQHLPTLELIYQISEKTADEFTIPEVLEALGDAYIQADQLEKAEDAYAKLVAREPENEHYRGLLKQALQKQGKEYVPASAAALSAQEMALQAPGEAVESPEEAAMVKEAIENSDFFVRYNLTEKAVAEMEKVLAVYPNQLEIHMRILEACRKNLPARAAQAARVLARIYTDRGDPVNAQRYEDAARQLGAPGSAESAAPAAASPAGIDLSQDFAFSAPEAPETEAPQEIPLDLGPGGDGIFPSAPAAFEEAARPGSIPAEAEIPPFNYQESEEEIRFYLSQGLVAEAAKAVEELKARYPSHSEVAKLAERVEAASGAARGPQDAPAAAREQAEEWELPTQFAKLPAPAGDVPAAPLPPAAEPPPEGGADLLGSLASDLASTLGDMGTPGTPASEEASPAQPVGAAAGGESASPLSGLLDELGEAEPSQAGDDDPETHYNLGVAFREMGLLDESIGEFQKVVKGSSKGNFPPNFLQACTLLAACFKEKGMPAIAAKWYSRALELPGLDEEATLALQYDLGASYEEAGDAKIALEKFTEVYSQNIDYRDVAEKIRSLRQKTS
jgi:tetratricopeptide (TPR) repeat protein